MYLSGVVWHQQEEQRKLAAYEAEQHLTVFSDLPDDVNAALAKQFHKQFRMRVQIITKADEDIQSILSSQAPSASLPDMVIANQPVLQNGTARHWFSAYISEETGAVPAHFKDPNGYWCGLWYDPMVFIVNPDYFAKHGYAIHDWSSLIIDPEARLAFPDLAATDMASDYLCSFIEARGAGAALPYFKEIQRHVPVYSKSMSLSVRRVALGEADMGVVDAVTARQYAKDQIPIKIIYPQDGTTYWMIGAAITQWNGNASLASQFLDWLLSAEGTAVLHDSHLYVFPCDSRQPEEPDVKGQKLVLFPLQKNYTNQGRKDLTEWWIKSVRFGKDA